MSTTSVRRPGRALLAGAIAVAFLAGAPAARAATVGTPEVVAGGLEFPWEVTPLPDGRILVTERPGRVRVIGASGVRPAPAFADARANKFLGLAAHPSYACNRLLYLYVSYGPAGGNAVVRLRDDGTNLVEPTAIFEGIRSDGNHDGGRMKFGPDGHLYVTTGDVHDPSAPQDVDSLNGKILRIAAPGGQGDGAAPADNPYSAPGEARNRRFVWSLGHRHPQGIDWDAGGRMWESEHGPTGESYFGGKRYRDEVNRIVAGGNYGWPRVMGEEPAPAGTIAPAATSGPSSTWAPGGAAFGPDGVLYAPLLAAKGVLEVSTSGDAVTGVRETFDGTFGRMRTAVSSNGHLWLTTSNNSSNEKLLRVPFDRPSPPLVSGVCATASPPAPAGGTGTRVTRDVASRTSRRALGRLLVRARTRLRKDGLRKLARRGHLTVRATGLRAGRVSLRLKRDEPKRRRLALAAGERKVRGSAAKVRSPLTAIGRRAVRRSPGMRIRVRAAFRPAHGRREARSLVVSVRR